MEIHKSTRVIAAIIIVTAFALLALNAIGVFQFSGLLPGDLLSASHPFATLGA
jgi:hypothetical protein